MSTHETSSAAGLQFARAMAAFAVMIVMGYAFSTSPVESAIDAPAATAQENVAPTPYFPAQYVNQGTEISDQVQAF